MYWYYSVFYYVILTSLLIPFYLYSIIILLIWLELQWLFYFYFILLFGGIFMFLLFHLLLFNCIISIWLIIGVFLNNGWLIILCIFAKIGFPPFIILFIYIWMGSNWWFIGVDMVVKLGYIYGMVLIMDLYNWVFYMEMIILMVIGYSWMYNYVRWIWTMKVLVMISGMMNGVVMYNCVLVCGVLMGWLGYGVLWMGGLGVCGGSVMV